jgi:membrane protease YdiL (CAAX protease family)
VPSENPQGNGAAQPQAAPEVSAKNAPPATPPGVPESRPSERRWSLRDLLLFLAWAGLALLASNILVVLVYAALQPLLGWNLPPRALRDNPFYLLTLQTAFHGLVLAYIYFLVVVSYRQRFWAGLKWRSIRTSVALQYLVGGFFLAIAVQLTPALFPDKQTFPLLRLFTSPGAAYAMAAFAILVAPFMEELIFRGVLFAFFEHLVGVRFAVLGTALLFAALHVPEYWGAWNHAFMILLVGLVFSLARGVTGSLAPSVMLHVAYNTTLMAALFFATHHFHAVTGFALP